jgi:exodeoxyribonuclease VII small subunit
MTPRKPTDTARDAAPSGREGSFEKSLERLQEIVRSLEEGGVTLDESVRMYEEGIRISRSCLEHLTRVESTVKRLSKDIQGEFSLADEQE